MPNMSYLTRASFDFGAINSLSAELEALGIKKPLICTDKGIVAAGILDTVKGAMPHGDNVVVFDGTPGNPTEAATLEALELYREAGCDGLIALGGGSSMDLAKGVGLLATHEGNLEDFAAIVGGGGKIGTTAPMIAIPTTSGTGSEVSVGSVIIMNNGRKETFASNNLLPDLALCDPELTLGLPPMLTAATGMDAVTHCIEAYLSAIDNPPASAIALDGLERAVGEGNLERAVKDGSDRDARYQMMMASLEGALSFIKGLGAVHSMSHAAGRVEELKLHHGTLNAVILPCILRFNEAAVGDRYPKMRRAMGLAEGADVAAYVEELNARIGLPANLAEMGVTEDMIPEMVEYATNDVAHFSTPRPPSPEEYTQLYREAMGLA